MLTVNIPPRDQDLVTLIDDHSDAAALHWLTAAHAIAVASLVAAMRVIDGPSITVTTFDTQ